VRRPTEHEVTDPSPSELQHLLGDLLGVPVIVRAGAAPGGLDGLVGCYRTPEGEVVAAIWLDRALAACAGAALAMLPAETVVAACARGALPEAVAENATEVLIVLAGVVHAAPRVTLSGAAVSPPRPEELTALLARPVGQAWFTVDVSGYGGGAAVVAQAR
jgi:hypothetical protein